MSLWQFLLRSLAFHWRMHLAVALGVAAATAVLTGALTVGDSVRGSLRHLTLDRLGRIDQVLVLDRFFSQELASQVAAHPELKPLDLLAVPAILFPSATVQTQSDDGRRLASGVLVIGSEPSFWDLSSGNSAPKTAPAAGEI